MTLGKKIAVLRIRKGMSYNEFADIVGVKRQTVLKWESDKALPKTESLLAISKYFNVSIGDLLNDDLDIFSKEYAMKKQLEAETGVRLTMKETSLYLKQLRENPKMLKADCRESIKEKKEQKIDEDKYLFEQSIRIKWERQNKKTIIAIFSTFIFCIAFIIALVVYKQAMSLVGKGYWSDSCWHLVIDDISILCLLGIHFFNASIVQLIVLFVTYRKKLKHKREIGDILR